MLTWCVCSFCGCGLRYTCTALCAVAINVAKHLAVACSCRVQSRMEQGWCLYNTYGVEECRCHCMLLPPAKKPELTYFGVHVAGRARPKETASWEDFAKDFKEV